MDRVLVHELLEVLDQTTSGPQELFSVRPQYLSVVQLSRSEELRSLSLGVYSFCEEELPQFVEVFDALPPYVLQFLPIQGRRPG